MREAQSSQELNEPDKYKWWDNFDRFDILIIGRTSNIHTCLELCSFYNTQLFHTHTHTKIIKHPQTPNKRNPHIMIHLNLSGFHDWNHHLINQIISSSFQNKIPMLKKIAPLFYFLFKSNIIHQPLLKVTHRILHHLAYNSNSDHTTKAMVS